MKMARNLMFMGLGVGATLAYQKYKTPVKKEVEKVVNKTVAKANKTLDEMM